MRTIHRSCHRCPFPKPPPPPLLQATAVTPPGRKPIFHMPMVFATEGRKDRVEWPKKPAIGAPKAREEKIGPKEKTFPQP